MSLRAILGFVAGGLAAAVACTQTPDDVPVFDDGNSSTCLHDPAFMTDAGPDAAPTCNVAKHYLSSDGTGGIRGGCATDLDTCPDSAGYSFSNCANQCSTGEYAAFCGGPGSGSFVVPKGCRTASNLPGGFAIYCCPCG